MFERRFKDYYGIQYNHHGTFQFARGDDPLREYDGSYAFVTHPGPPFRYGTTPDRPRHHCYVCFKGPRVDRLIHSGLLPIDSVPGPIRINDAEQFYLTFLELLNAFTRRPSSPRCTHILEGLLLQMHESTGNRLMEGDTLREQIAKLGHDIMQNPRRPWDFREAAHVLNISYPHFRRRFSETHDAPPGQFLLNARLNHAAQILTHSGIPIRLVAEKAGIEDMYHFSKLFKKQFHLPPGRYRKEFSTENGKRGHAI